MFGSNGRDKRLALCRGRLESNGRDKRLAFCFRGLSFCLRDWGTGEGREGAQPILSWWLVDYLGEVFYLFGARESWKRSKVAKRSYREEKWIWYVIRWDLRWLSM